MQFFVNAKAFKSGNGSEEYPFKTITEAADVAGPGDEVIVYPGIYRENVNPKNAGLPGMNVVYRSKEPLKAVITGSERITNWEPYEGDVWVSRIGNGIFGEYNPYTTLVYGDWFIQTMIAHTGEVYLNEKSLYEVTELEKVLNPVKYEPSWDADFSLHTWYTEQDAEKNETVIYANFGGLNPNEEEVEINVRRNCFYPQKEGVGYITLSGFTVKRAATQWAPPTGYQEGMIGPHWSKGWIIEDCDVYQSKCSGISLGKYLQPNNDNKWSKWKFKDGTQTERDAICQAQFDGWSKETIGSHIIRRCNIHDCGQTGIVGHLGGVFSLIEDNHIHHINNKQNLAGAEIGGIKMHAAIDVIIRRNHFHHCTRGLWLDWQAQGTRVTQNLFHDNTLPKDENAKEENALGLGEDIFVEVSHGPTLIDNNIMLSDCAMRLSTQGFALVHNLIAGSFVAVGQGVNNGSITKPSPRYTPYHMPHRTEVAGFMTILHGDARFYNNIFIQKPVRPCMQELSKAMENNAWSDLNMTVGTVPFDEYPTLEEYCEQFVGYCGMGSEQSDRYYNPLPVWTGGNVFFNGAKPVSKEKDYYADDTSKVFVEVVENNGKVCLRTNVYDSLSKSTASIIDSETLGLAFEPEQRFENPDGSEIVFDEDFFGNHRAANPTVGPFEESKGIFELFDIA
ncbi:MAG: right-handed parallel beta-helix repeat-containing protein [Lachnospiraceae bacterium]|nr:right-handed parallel beta-helix repeat-containing protein [Lachnospiraceae bacterium]